MNEDKAARYHRLGRRSDLLGLLWGGVLLCGLALTSGAGALRDSSAGLVQRTGIPSLLAPIATVAVYVIVLAALHGAFALPLAFYRGFILERRFGLSRQTARSWIWNHLKVVGLTLVLATAAACVVYVALGVWPNWWWIAVWTVFCGASVLLAHAAPVVLLPLLFTLAPLSRTDLRDRLTSLARRAKTAVLSVHEWRVSDRTRRVQAALVGLGSTRRILLSDTLLADYSDEEIEVILAHELGHHVRHDLWRGLLAESLLSLCGFYAAHRMLVAAGPAAGLRGPDDVAGLPVLLLTAGVVSAVTIPLANSLSRWIERRADRFALQLTRNPGAFVAAMKRMAAQNLAEERPSAFALGFFYTHPPVAERISMAQQWAASSPRESGPATGPGEAEAET